MLCPRGEGGGSPRQFDSGSAHREPGLAPVSVPPPQVVTSLPAHKQPGQPGASLLTCDLTEPWRLEVFHVGMNGVGRGRKALKSSDCGSRLHGSIGSRHLARTVGRSVPVQLCRNQLACSLPGDMCVRVHACVLTPLPAGTAVWWFS